MDESQNDPLADVGANRRRFIKGVVATTAFAVPMVSSFDLASLANAQTITIANGSNGTSSIPPTN